MSLKGSFRVGVNDQIQTQLNQQLQVLMLAQKFGFSQTELVKLLGVDTKGFNNSFDATSLKALTKDKKFNQTLGEPGALISLLFGNMMKITNPVITKLLNGALGMHVTGDEYSSAEITKALEFFMRYLTPFLKGINFANMVQEVGAILPSVKLDDSQLNSLTTGVDGFVNGNVNQKYVQPIIKGIQSGLDLTRFADKTLDVLMVQMVNQIVNALGYALRDEYQPIIGLDGEITHAVTTFTKMITNKEFKNFNFNRNPEKFTESASSAIAMLNHILTIFKTADVLPTGEQASQHLFSNEQTNDEFAKAIYKKDLQTLVGSEALKTLNVNELLSNLLYFVGGNNEQAQYRLQKLLYILLYQGDKMSALGVFGVTIGLDLGLGK